jgi:hypothetical protein
MRARRINFCAANPVQVSVYPRKKSVPIFLHILASLVSRVIIAKLTKRASINTYFPESEGVWVNVTESELVHLLDCFP